MNSRTSLVAPLLATLTWSASLAACGDDGSQVPPRVGALPSGATPTAGPAPVPPAPSSTAQDRGRAPAARLRDRPDPRVAPAVRSALREGRELSHAGRHVEALAAFERALAANPGSARLRCEAGFVAFRAGRLDVAERYVRAALRSLENDQAPPPSLVQPLASCLFNAGLVAEANGKPEDARRSYQRSLAIRPNATVQARLDALAAPSAAPASSVPPAAASASEQARAAFCELSGGMDVACGEAVTPDVTVQHPSTAGSPGLDAEVAVATSDDTPFEASTYALHVVYGSSRVVGTIGYEWNPGIGGVSAETEVQRFEWLDVLPGGAPELVLELVSRENDEDMGVCERNGGTTVDLFVCSADDGSLNCAKVRVRETRYFERDEGCEEDSGPATAEQRGYHLAYRFEGGSLVLTREPESPEGPPAGLGGRIRIATLLADPTLGWP